MNVALRKESVDRNKIRIATIDCIIESLSARRAWIEIIMFVNLRVLDGVALRKESVDRNSSSLSCFNSVSVALRKESVDRNCRNRFCPTCQWVALRKESVDRNLLFRLVYGSLITVALRKESVDRNCTSIKHVRWMKRRSPQGERG